LRRHSRVATDAGFALTSGSAFDHPAIHVFQPTVIFIIPNRTVSFPSSSGLLNTSAVLPSLENERASPLAVETNFRFWWRRWLMTSSNLSQGIRCLLAACAVAEPCCNWRMTWALWLERSLAAPHQLVAVATPVPVPAMLLLCDTLIQPLNLLQQLAPQPPFPDVDVALLIPQSPD